MLFEVLVCLPILFLLWLLLQHDSPPELGVYSFPGRWYHVKYFLFRLMLYRRRKQQQKSRKDEQQKSAGYGCKSHGSNEMMERPQVLGTDTMALDCVYMNGMDKDGTCFVMRVGRRHNRRAELWLSVRLSDGSFYQSPVHPDTTIYNTNGSTWCAAGLSMECLEPMRRWKVSYNGLLRRGLCNEYSEVKDNMVHVAFSFVWTAFSDVHDFDTDIDPGLLAAAIATEPWSKEFWDTLKNKHQTHYEQWGELRGTIKVKGQDMRRLYLRGVRDHSYGVRDWRMFHRYVVHFGYLEDGSTFHVNMICWAGGLTRFQCGYMSLPNATMVPITSTDINLAALGENLNPPDVYSFSFTAGGKSYNASVHCNICPMYYHQEDWGNVIFEKFCDFNVNGIKGYGITEFCDRRHGSTSPVPLQESLPLLSEPDVLPDYSSSAYILPFTDPACSSSRLVGGKGCQLGLLTRLQSKDFIVPQGFCVTLAAFEHQLKSFPDWAEKIGTLQEAACGKQQVELPSACTVVHTAVSTTELDTEIRHHISTQLTRQFGEDFTAKMFAVRSSAAGEDSVEMSAAGQMDTFLGVKGLQSICEAVCKCWASQFGHIAVEYRRQHGQPIQCGMGVVIQEMVPAQAAGVLFTREPLTGSNGSMIINANYGLGESVVSGESEPDMVTVNRTWDDKLTIGDKNIGRKKLQMHLADSGGIENKEGLEDCAATCCVSDEVILRLAHIGVELEKRFADPRDIEFAVRDGDIYLLQARPITSLDQDDEWDLLHEFDSALCHDNEITTTCNIGEMMPSAMTPLTLSTFFKSIDFVSQGMYARAGAIPVAHDFLKFAFSYNNMGFLNMHMLTCLNETTGLGMKKNMAELAIMGETRQDFTLDEVIQYHGTRDLFTRIYVAYKHAMNVRSGYYDMKRWEEILQTFTISGREFDSTKQLYDCLTDQQHFYEECWSASLYNSSSSATWSSVLMGILSKGEPVWTNEHYSDVAMLLSQCEDVYSADVPTALQSLVDSLRGTGQAEHLLSLSPKGAADWLLTGDSGNAGQSCKEFFKRHGHRCVKEAEFLEKSWQTEPHKVVSVIQAMLANSPMTRKERKVFSEAEAIKNIKSPITTVGRLVLKWVLPKARKSVGYREWGKSLAVKMTEVFKQGYWKLAELMVSEGRLPREELLFFLTHREIGQLLDTRSGKLVARAQRRCKIYPKQLEMTYHRINRGRPALIDDSSPEDDFVITSLKIQGMPVSQGVIRGKARVVKTLKEAASIKPGEILVVPFTDVGWSPYFPLISGLVTEMGGLLSHGAVVAREYGLPCAVKVQRATILFKTGDDVILNGTTGTFEKLEASESGSEHSQ